MSETNFNEQIENLLKEIQELKENQKSKGVKPTVQNSKFNNSKCA